MDCVKCEYYYSEHEVGEVCKPCMDDQRIADQFTPQLSYDQVQLVKAECCIICETKVENFCPEVPHCSSCDEVVVADYASANFWYEEV